MNGIARLRVEQDLTQEELAVEVGVTANTVARWEAGVRKPSFANMARLKESLRCSYDEIHEDNLKENPTQPRALRARGRVRRKRPERSPVEAA